MNVRKTDDFMADLERQYNWYIVKAGLEVADHYLDAVQANCQLLSRHPFLGPQGGFAHPRLRDWRFFWPCARSKGMSFFMRSALEKL
jgi:plasmid stabilization system protein ParE